MLSFGINDMSLTWLMKIKATAFILKNISTVVLDGFGVVVRPGRCADFPWDFNYSHSFFSHF